MDDAAKAFEEVIDRVGRRLGRMIRPEGDVVEGLRGVFIVLYERIAKLEAERTNANMVIQIAADKLRDVGLSFDTLLHAELAELRKAVAVGAAERLEALTFPMHAFDADVIGGPCLRCGLRPVDIVDMAEVCRPRGSRTPRPLPPGTGGR